MTKRGPKTEAGRAAVRLNAWKHGILSQAVVLPKREDQRDWQAHSDGVNASLAPEGHLEFMLAERIAICLWKLRRLEFYQMQVMMQAARRGQSNFMANPDRVMKYFKTGVRPTDDDVGDPSPTLLPNGWFLPTIIRYESHLHRLMIQTLHELEAMQSRRKGQSTPLARLDITGAPS